MISREPIMAALFAKLQTVQGFATSSRRLLALEDIQNADLPALYLTQRTEKVETKPPGMNPVSVFTCDVHLYITTGADRTVAPDTILNPLVDAIAAVLAPDNVVTNRQTLGGLVQHCWIEGLIEYFEGVLGPVGVVIIPIVIKAA